MHAVVTPGVRVELILPHSEVYMHMRVAGKRAFVTLSDSEYPMAQISKKDGTPFSSPVLPGEAGVMHHANAERNEDHHYFMVPTPSDPADWLI